MRYFQFYERFSKLNLSTQNAKTKCGKRHYEKIHSCRQRYSLDCCLRQVSTSQLENKLTNNYLCKRISKFFWRTFFLSRGCSYPGFLLYALCFCLSTFFILRAIAACCFSLASARRRLLMSSVCAVCSSPRTSWIPTLPMITSIPTYYIHIERVIVVIDDEKGQWWSSCCLKLL